MGSDKEVGKFDEDAKPYELFFIQKERSKGQIKSMLVAHDTNRLKDQANDRKHEVRGGIPLFEKNLPIRGIPTNNASTNYEIQIGNQSALVKYNMKWDNDQIENDYKYAFLKTLWLQINAELFEQGFKPTKLKWAYPGAMSRTIQGKYTTLWADVTDSVTPIYSDGSPVKLDANNDIAKTTEGKAVACYATTNNRNMPGGGLTPAQQVLAIGYDVGGSTTDILMLLESAETGENEFTLAKESSILVAAHSISDAAKRSSKIRDTLKRFLSYKKIHIYGIENINEDTAAYFLNAVFDRLDKHELQSLYRYFHTYDCTEVFAIASYVCGLILYYTGQLAARVIEKQGLTIDRFDKGFYGKGGNIFNWIITVMPEAGRAYYEECFMAGIDKENRVAELSKEKAELTVKEELTASEQTRLEEVEAIFKPLQP